MSLMISVRKKKKEKYWVNFGYGEFKRLRDALALKVGYEYVYDQNYPFNVQLKWDSSIEKQELTDFFLHSDSDGKVKKKNIELLYKDFDGLMFDDENEQVGYDKFFKLLEDSAKHGYHWHFL